MDADARAAGEGQADGTEKRQEHELERQEDKKGSPPDCFSHCRCAVLLQTESTAGMTRSQWERTKSSSGSSASASGAGGFMDRRPSGAQQQQPFQQQGAYGARQMVPVAAAGQQQMYVPQQQQQVPQFMQRPMAQQQQQPARYASLQQQPQHFVAQAPYQQQPYQQPYQQQPYQQQQQQPGMRSAAPVTLPDRMFAHFLQLAALPENVETGADLNVIAAKFNVPVQQVSRQHNTQREAVMMAMAADVFLCDCWIDLCRWWISWARCRRKRSECIVRNKQTSHVEIGGDAEIEKSDSHGVCVCLFLLASDGG